MDKLLPIGSVVKLKDINKPYMITSHMIKNENNEIDTYLGVPFPIGKIDIFIKKTFNPIDIEEIYFIGYLNPESEEYLKKVGR